MFKICPTVLQAVMYKIEQMERSMMQMKRSNQQMERSMAQMDRSNQQMERSMQQMERSMEELKQENRRAMNIGPEMDQEIDTNVYQ